MEPEKRTMQHERVQNMPKEGKTRKSNRNRIGTSRSEVGKKKYSDDLLYKYLSGLRFVKVLQSGVMNLPTAGNCECRRPGVWFSANPVYDHSANEIIPSAEEYPCLLDKEQTEEECGGLFRIGVHPDTAPVSWEEFKEADGMDLSKANTIEEVARMDGDDPEDWFASYNPVQSSEWVVCQFLDDDTWVTMEPDEIEAIKNDPDSLTT
jgi:hypothetical protein